MNTTLSTALPPNTLLGNYELRSVLGHGGGGISYLAYDSALEREVVLKEHFPFGLCRRADNRAEVLPEDAELYKRSLAVFCKEARILAGLNHPNVVKVHDIFEGAGTAYLVMEYVEARTLKDYLHEQAANVQEVQRVLMNLLHTLHYLHDNKIIHRDIKPGNILIKENGHPVIIDFGAAHLGTINHTLTPVGSPGYAAPEQFSPSGRVGPWSDLFALAQCFIHHLPSEQKNRYPKSFIKSLQKAASAEVTERFASATDWLRYLAPSQKEAHKTLQLTILSLLCIAIFAVLYRHPNSPSPEPPQPEPTSAGPASPKAKELSPLPEPPLSQPDSATAKIPMGTLLYPAETPPTVPEEALFNSSHRQQNASIITQFRAQQAEYRQKYKDYCHNAALHNIPMSAQEEYLQKLTDAYRHNLKMLVE